MGLHSDTNLYRSVAELGTFVARATSDFRRDIKPTYGKLLVEESVWMAVLVREANIARGADKIPHLDDLLRSLELIQFTLRVLLDIGWLARNTFAASVPLTTSIGKQANALRTHFHAPASSPAA
jgi:hypothetical protein